MHSGGSRPEAGSHAAHARSGASGLAHRLSVLVSLGFLIMALVVLLGYRLFSGGHLASKVEAVAIGAPFVIVVLVGQGFAVYLAARRTRPRPRWHYFLFSIGYLVVTIVAASIGGQADSDHMGWLSTAMLWPAGLSFAGALVMFGRGALRGRLRRSLWKFRHRGWTRRIN